MPAGYFFVPRARQKAEYNERLYDYRAAVHSGQRGLTTTPVYLALRDDAVDFCFLGRLRGQRRIAQRLILRLPIGQQAILEGELDDAVAFSFGRVWPLHASDSTPLVSLKKVEAVGYSSLDEFCDGVGDGVGRSGALSTCAGGSLLRVEQAGQLAVESDGAIPIGRLLLDFLFDLAHSGVFGQHRPRLLMAFRSSPALAALMDKLEYLWGRERVAKLPAAAANDPRVQELWSQEQAWLDQCLDPDASRHLRSKWFYDIEDEVKRVVFPLREECQPGSRKELEATPRNGDAAEVEKERSRRLNRVATWFLRRYELDCFLLAVLRDAKSDNTWLSRVLAWLEMSPAGWCIVGFLMIAMILYTGIRGVWAASTVVGAVLTGAAASIGALLIVGICWWLTKANGALADSTQFRRAHPVRYLILLSVVAVALLYVLADLGAFEAEAGAVARRFLYMILAASLILGLPLYAAVLIIVRRLRARLLGVLRLGLPRMFLAVTAAWTLMMTTDEVVKANLLVGWSEILPVLITLALLAWLFASVEVHAQIGSTRTALGRAAWLVATSFLISYIVGFAATGFVAPRYLLQSGFVGGTEFEARASRYDDENRGHVPKFSVDGSSRDHDKILNRLEQLQWGADGAGLTGSERAGIRVLYTTEIPVLGRVYFFPGLHLYTALFAMFVGLFFTLVLDGRLLTEPLRDPDTVSEER